MEKRYAKPCLINAETGSYHGVIGTYTETVEGIDYHVGDIIVFTENGKQHRGIITGDDTRKDEGFVYFNTIEELKPIKVVPFNLVTKEIIKEAIGIPLEIYHLDVLKGTRRELEEHFEAILIIED